MKLALFAIPLIFVVCPVARAQQTEPATSQPAPPRVSPTATAQVTPSFSDRALSARSRGNAAPTS